MKSFNPKLGIKSLIAPSLCRSSILSVLTEMAPPNPYYLKALYILGQLYLVYWLVEILVGVYLRFIRPGKNLKKVYGEWAVITGATDGMGKAMAFEMARKGQHIFLLSRSQDKLDATRSELLTKYPNIEVKSLAVDFTKFDGTSRQKIADALKGLQVGVLVNNVGISYPYTRYYFELADETVEQLISLNVQSATWMTRIVLPGMIERRKGAIVNVSSVTGVAVAPLLAQYGASKSYLVNFSKALAEEYKSFNIDVQCQVPMLVATKLSKIQKPSLFVPTAAAYGRAAVHAIGCGSTVISPYWSHAVQVWLMTTLPEWMTAQLVLGMHLGIRRAGIKKEERLKAEGTTTAAAANVAQSAGAIRPTVGSQGKIKKGL